MARHASLMDVFNAAAGAASPFIQHTTRELQERHDLALKNNATRFAIDVENYLRDNPYNGNYDEYLGKIQDYTDKWYAGAAGGNSSPYFQKNIEQMRQMSLLQAEEIALKKEDAWRIEKLDVDHANAINRIQNSGFDTRNAFEAMMIEHESYSNSRGLTPAETAKDKASIYSGVLDRALAIDVSGIETVEDAHKLIDENVKNLEAVINERENTGEGEDVLDQWIADKEGKIKDARNAAYIAITKRKVTELDTLDNKYRREAGDALKSGDAGRIQKALTLWREGCALRDAAMKSPDYNPADRPRIAGMFPEIQGLTDVESSGKGGGWNDDEIKKMMPSFVQAALDGFLNDPSNRITGYDAREAFEEAVFERVCSLGYKGSRENLRQNFPVTANFFGELEKAMGDTAKGPEYAERLAAIETIKEFVLNEYENTLSEMYPGQKKLLAARAEERAWDILLSSYLPGLDSKELVEKTKRFVNTLRAEELGILQRDLKTGESKFIRTGTDSDKDIVARAVYALKQPDVVWTNTRGQRRFNGIDEGIANEVINKALPARLLEELKARGENVQRSDIVSINFTQTEGLGPFNIRPRDEDGIIEYRLRNGNTYRFMADNPKELNLEEKRAGSDTWEPIAGTTVETRQREERALRATKEEERRQLRERETYVFKSDIAIALEKNENPLDGTPFDCTKEPPPVDSSVPNPPRGTWRNRWKTLSKEEKVLKWRDYYLDIKIRAWEESLGDL